MHQKTCFGGKFVQGGGVILSGKGEGVTVPFSLKNSFSNGR